MADMRQLKHTQLSELSLSLSVYEVRPNEYIYMNLSILTIDTNETHTK